MDRVARVIDHMEEYVHDNRRLGWMRVDGTVETYCVNRHTTSVSYRWCMFLVHVPQSMRTHEPNIALGLIYQYASDPLV
jgi:hypothetical protein